MNLAIHCSNIDCFTFKLRWVKIIESMREYVISNPSGMMNLEPAILEKYRLACISISVVWKESLGEVYFFYSLSQLLS
jgi:hypothetical protein